MKITIFTLLVALSACNVEEAPPRTQNPGILECTLDTMTVLVFDYQAQAYEGSTFDLADVDNVELIREPEREYVQINFEEDEPLTYGLTILGLPYMSAWIVTRQCFTNRRID